MGYETDHPPIVYLERRIKYYKKRRGNARGWPNDEYYLRRYGKKEIKRISKAVIARYDERIKEYEKAIEILKKNEKGT